jgi:hypothetical protein
LLADKVDHIAGLFYGLDGVPTYVFVDFRIGIKLEHTGGVGGKKLSDKEALGSERERHRRVMQNAKGGRR